MSKPRYKLNPHTGRWDKIISPSPCHLEDPDISIPDRETIKNLFDGLNAMNEMGKMIDDNLMYTPLRSHIFIDPHNEGK